MKTQTLLIKLAFLSFLLAACTPLETKLKVDDNNQTLTSPITSPTPTISNCSVSDDFIIGSNLYPPPAIPNIPSNSAPIRTIDYQTAETPVNWNYQATIPSTSACAAGEGYAYHVGPAYPYKELRDIPWQNLTGCDQVLIHYRSEPYRDIIYFTARGAKNKYITIQGVPGPNCERPVLDGNNAVMPSNTGANTYWDSAGMIIFGKPNNKSPKSNGYKPGYVHITGLKIQNVRAPSRVKKLSITNSDTSTWPVWDGFTAAIYAHPVEHLAITNCELKDSGLGLFINSTSGTNDSQSRDILIAKNYIHGNGIVGEAGMHNSYTEAIGVIYEHNYFGAPISGTAGDNIKERSAGIVFRYNFIEDGVNLISLRDPQSNGTYEALAKDNLGEDLTSKAFIYGNHFSIKSKNAYGNSPFVIGYGDGVSYGDGKQYRYGKLFFYHNKVTTKMGFESYHVEEVPLFAPINERSVVTIVAKNNLFYSASKTNGNAAAPFALFYAQGIADWSSNWINLFKNTAETVASGGLAVGPIFNGSGLGGLSHQTNSPGFNNFSANDYSLRSDSPYNSLKETLPSDILNRGLQSTDLPTLAPFK